MQTYHTNYTIIPFFFAAKLVCCVLISIVNQIKLSWEHVHSITNKQVLCMEVVIFGPSQKYSLVFYIKLRIKTNILVVNQINFMVTQENTPRRIGPIFQMLLLTGEELRMSAVKKTSVLASQFYPHLINVIYNYFT